MRNKFARVLLAIAIAIGFSPASYAQQDKHFSGASYYVTLATAVPWSQLAGNYIFTPQSPNVGLCMFVENSNTTFTHAITIAAFQTGNPSLSSYQANSGLWAASSIVGNFTTVSPATVQSVFINATGAANVAIVISGTAAGSGSPDVANVFVVQSTVQQCGSANSAQIIMGDVPAAAGVSKVNPVLVCGEEYAGGTCQPPAMLIDGVGNYALELANPTPALGDGQLASEGTGPFKSASGPVVMSAPQLTDSTGHFVRVKSVDTFNAVSTAAAGNTAVWTPGAGNKFHLECIAVEITGDATLAVAGEETITLQDQTTNIPGFLFVSFVPSAALNTRGALYQSGPVCFHNGYLSSTNANVLNVNLSTALTAGKVVVRAWGVVN